MRRLLYGCSAAAAVGLLALGASDHVDAQASQNAIVIEGGTLIDGNGGAPVRNAAIVIENNRITQVGRKGRVRRPAGAQVINADGKYIMPGLIDAKANYTSSMNEPYVAWGVTSAVWSGGGGDTGVALRDAINGGMLEGPRLFVSYAAINGPGMDGKARDNGIPGRYAYIVRTPEEARDLSAKFFDAGADFISSGDGAGSPELFKAMVDEAKRRGKASVMRSVGPGTAAKELADMGADVAIHAGQVGIQITTDATAEKWKNYTALAPDEYSDMDDNKARAMAKYLADRKLVLEPDVIAMDRGFMKSQARMQQENLTWHNNDPALMSYYPKSQQAGYIENVKFPETYLTPAELDVRKRGYQNKMRFLKMFVDAGGKLVTASDIPQSPPGIGVHQEITAFVEDVGLTPMQAILSATGWAADGFKLADLGRIQPGKLADIVIVDADPLQDILNTRKVNTVIKDGKIIDRSYTANYPMIFQGACCNGNPVVENEGWVAALKQGNWNPNARNGGWGGVGGIDSAVSPTPAIESLMPYTVNLNSPATAVTIKGFNYVLGSKVTVDGKPVPTKVVSRTEIQGTVDPAVLAQPGRHQIRVVNPEPMARNLQMWGDTSNPAYLLVPTRFTTTHSQNRF